MDPITLTSSNAQLVRDLGFPIAVAVFALSIVGAMAWSSHRFITHTLVQVLNRCTTALADAASATRDNAHEVEQLADRLDECPHRNAFWQPDHPLHQQPPAAAAATAEVRA